MFYLFHILYWYLYVVLARHSLVESTLTLVPSSLTFALRIRPLSSHPETGSLVHATRNDGSYPVHLQQPQIAWRRVRHSRTISVELTALINTLKCLFWPWTTVFLHLSNLNVVTDIYFHESVPPYRLIEYAMISEYFLQCPCKLSETHYLGWR